MCSSFLVYEYFESVEMKGDRYLYVSQGDRSQKERIHSILRNRDWTMTKNLQEFLIEVGFSVFLP